MKKIFKIIFVTAFLLCILIIAGNIMEQNKTYKIEFDDKISNAFNFENFLMEKGSALDEPVNDYDDETDLSSEDENENNESIIFLTERQ